MSWIDRTENTKFQITTGDGKVFFPLWQIDTVEQTTDFNSTAFNFINVSGTLVERRKEQSGKTPLTFYFQGSDNIEQTTAFLEAAKDSRMWTVVHPFYGTLKGQPVSLTRRDAMQLTQVTVDFWESIDVDYPNTNFSVKDNTLEKKDAVLAAGASSYSNSGVLSSADINTVKESNMQTNAAFESIQTDETATDYQNQLAKANKALDNLLPSPFNAIIQTQALLNLPSTYNIPVLNRLKAYINSFERLYRQFNTLGDKYFFESQGATAIASYANAAVNPIEGDYETMPEVQQASTDLQMMYENYLQTLDGISVGQYQIGQIWQPDPTVQQQLSNLVQYTIANLYSIAFEAQQERVVYTETDTNIILLTHRYIGLDANDTNIEKFRKINNIKLNELFMIKKGRKIIYYV